MNLFQSTHPHGVRLHAPGSVWVPLSVSIHAPARGATNTVLKAFDRSGVSIHAPARGATGVCARLAERVRVSIHAPARGATPLKWSHCVHSFVSIHAPARGATQFTSDVDYILLFQSTHPHGVRRVNPMFKIASLWFQSTHPHGVRLFVESVGCNIFCFNPRTRTGCDTWRLTPCA